MRLYELIVMGCMLIICEAGVCWFLYDMFRQLRIHEERCEGLEEDDEE